MKIVPYNYNEPFFSFCNAFSYTQPTFVFDFLVEFYNFYNHIVASSPFSSLEIL